MKVFLKKNITVVIMIAFLLLVALLYFFVKGDEKEELTTFSMGSYVTQTVYGSSGQEAMAQVASEITELENRISWRIDGSDTSLINKSEEPISVEQDSMDLINLCLEVSKKTQGAFDISIAPLSLLWDFDSSPTTLPSDEDIKEKLELVHYENIIVQNDTVLLKENSQIDLGAVGKGAACDTAVAVYESMGINSAIIAVGGSIGTLGENPVNGKWNIAIRDPYGSQNAMASLSIEEGFVSTSGTYEKTFEYEGKSYHHILNPKTGYPSDSDIISVTVVCDSGALSDALSTACLVLGYEESLAVLEDFNAQAVFVTKDHEIYMTDEIKGQFELLSEDFTVNG